MISYHHHVSARLGSLAALPDDGKWEKLITEKVNKCNGRGEVYLFFNKTNERTILRVSPRRIRSLFWVVLDHHPAPPTLYLPPPYHRHDSVFTVRIAIKRSSHINNNRQTDGQTERQAHRSRSSVFRPYVQQHQLRFIYGLNILPLRVPYLG